MVDVKKQVNDYLDESLKLAQDQKLLVDTIVKISSEWIKCIENGGKLIFMGNGGSASDSQHIVAELVGRFQLERNGLPAISLSSNIAVITAIANDFGYENIFQKQIEAIATNKDLVIGITTSGKSENIVRALKFSKDEGLKTIGFTGSSSKDFLELCDLAIQAPSTKPSLIQQCHITVGQLLCGIVEDYFFNK
jgi:D-sedoheptulose 7-phosphate isomerase